MAKRNYVKANEAIIQTNLEMKSSNNKLIHFCKDSWENIKDRIRSADSPERTPHNLAVAADRFAVMAEE